MVHEWLHVVLDLIGHKNPNAFNGALLTTHLAFDVPHAPSGLLNDANLQAVGFDLGNVHVLACIVAVAATTVCSDLSRPTLLAVAIAAQRWLSADAWSAFAARRAALAAV